MIVVVRPNRPQKGLLRVVIVRKATDYPNRPGQQRFDFGPESPAYEQVKTLHHPVIKRTYRHSELPNDLYHVTTHKDDILRTGLLSRSELPGYQGLGGGNKDVAKSKVSTTWDLEHAKRIAKTLKLVGEVSQGKVKASEVIHRLRDIHDTFNYWGNPDDPTSMVAPHYHSHLAQLGVPLNILSHQNGGIINSYLNHATGNDPEAVYNLLQHMEYHLPGAMGSMPTILTAPFEGVKHIDPEQVHIFKVRPVYGHKNPEHVLAEHEFRFHPHQLDVDLGWDANKEQPIEKALPYRFNGSDTVDRVQNGRVYLTHVGAQVLGNTFDTHPLMTMATRGMYMPQENVDHARRALAWRSDQEHDVGSIWKQRAYHPHLFWEVFHKINGEDHNPIFTHEEDAFRWQDMHSDWDRHKAGHTDLITALNWASHHSQGNGAVIVHRNQPDSLYDRESDRAGIRNNIQTIRHEGIHQNREAVAGKPYNLWEDDDAVASHPHFMTAVKTLADTGYGGGVGDFGDEIMAHIGAGQHSEVGLRHEEAKDLLSHMIEHGVKTHGPAFYDIFKTATPSIRRGINGFKKPQG